MNIRALEGVGDIHPRNGVAFIYHLTDQSGTVRYVGKAYDPKARFKQHLHKNSGDDYRGRWIRKELAEGRSIAMVVVRVVLESEWEQAERDEISRQKALGSRLCNAAEGGRSPKGCLRTPAQIEAQQARMDKFRGTRAYRERMRHQLDGVRALRKFGPRREPIARTPVKRLQLFIRSQYMRKLPGLNPYVCRGARDKDGISIAFCKRHFDSLIKTPGAEAFVYGGKPKSG